MPSRASAREPRPRHRALRGRRFLCVAVLLVALPLAGCAGRAADESTADTIQGKELFVQQCGSCHTLADAATLGTVGPNLDDAFAAARSKNGGGFDESTFFQITLDQMRLPAPPMPDFDSGPQALPEQQLVDIAAYVASVAGEPPAEEGQQAAGETTGDTTTAP
jgi:mono/diheme cytochrome c family protein